VVVGGIIPDADSLKLEREGVDAIYTPKDYKLATIVGHIADLAIERRHRA
jgi:(2R)-ethylmalonyl-CoA mutase